MCRFRGDSRDGGWFNRRREYRGLEVHQQVRATDQFPPAFDVVVVGQAMVRLAKLILAVLGAVLDPGAQAVVVVQVAAKLSFHVGHYRGMW